MRKFAKGGFPSGENLFIHTSGELCGNFGGETLFPHKSIPISEELQKAVAKSLSGQKGSIEVHINGKENSEK